MKIICVGRNYADHAKELKNQVPAEPVIFCKPETAIPQNSAPFYIPEFSNDVHHEVEIVIKISKPGKHIAKEFAHKYFSEIGIGIDFTARDLQQKLKDKGLPWELAKGFDGSAPLGHFTDKNSLNNINDLNFRMEKNGEVVQRGNTKDMLFDFDTLISFVSRYFTLKKGDLIFTGTPAGVGPVAVGDKLVCFIEEKKMLQVMVK